MDEQYWAVMPQERPSRTRASRTRPAKTTVLKVVVVMPWLVLILSGLLETVWAIALAQSAGFTRLAPSALFLGALAGSMVGLGYAVRTIPLGTGYAVWVGIGVAGTALAGMLFFDESASVLRVLCLLLIFAGVVGLKVFH